MEINCLVAGYARCAGVPVMLNSAPYAPLPEDLLRNVTWLSPNEHEAALLTGMPVDADSAEQALRCMRDLGVENALITLGSRGAACLENDGKFVFGPAVKGLHIQDPTAAGDSFVGAFCVGLCSGLPVEAALRLANYTAGLTCCTMGAQSSLPTRAQVLELMRKHHADTAAIAHALAK